jgi:hypothetical protein
MNTDTERARFENWAEDEGYSLAVWAGGRYQSDTTESLWAAWQARAALPSAPSEGPSDKEMLDWLERWVLSIARLTSPDMSGIRFAGQAYNPAKERGEAGSSYIPLRGQTIRDLARAAIKASTP